MKLGIRLKCALDEEFALPNTTRGSIERVIPSRDEHSTFAFTPPKLSHTEANKKFCNDDDSNNSTKCMQWKISRSIIAGTRMEGTSANDMSA